MSGYLTLRVNAWRAALAGAGDVRALVLAAGALPEDVLDDLLRPERLAGVVPTVAC